MNNMDEQYGIVSKLDFSNLTLGAVPNTFTDNSITNLLWSATGNTGTTNMEITESNGIKILNCKTINNSKIYTQSLSSYSFNDTLSYQVEINVMIPSIKSDNIFFNISNTNGTKYSFNIKNTFNGGLTISNGATYKIVCNYKFENNVNYNIVVTKIGNNYSVMIDGLVVGNLTSSTFTNAYGGLMTYVVIGKSQQSTANITSEFVGQIWNVNMSMGNFLKYQNSFTKYGEHLLSRYNFDNLATNSTSTTFSFPVESVLEPKLMWTLNNPIFSTNGNGWCNNNNQSFTSIVPNLNTITFNMKNLNVHDDIDLINFSNKYKLKYSATKYVEPDPSPIVNSNTKSALDFENGLTDKIISTVWEAQGTAAVTTNKIFGDSSFETKSLGDYIGTNSSIITGDNTPFTIEFYGLISAKTGWSTTGYNQTPLFSKSNNSANGDQCYFVNHALGGKCGLFRNIYYEKQIPEKYGKTNIKFNEINKYVMSYDGSALRMFINDKLDNVIGTSVGLYQSTSEPFKFYDQYIPSYSSYRIGTNGLIDNINIFDGVATQVRDIDVNADKLIVDLALDGENNSTTIIDNGTLGLTWINSGNAKLSTDQKFDGYSSLYLDGTGDYIGTSNADLNFGTGDLTISFSTIVTSYTNQYQMIMSNSDPNKAYIVFWGDYSASPTLARKITIGINTGVFLTSTQTYELNTEYKIDIVRKNEEFSLFINNKLDSVLQTNVVFNLTESSNSIAIGYRLSTGNIDNYFSGYIKNFKIYKDVAIFPESNANKIQLDFDNNMIDKYNNSSWINNGATFDQVNSVKGYSTKYENGNHIISNDTSSLDFGTNDFNVSFDCMKNNLTLVAYLFSNNIIHSDASNKAVWFYKGSSANNFGYFDYKDKPTNTTYHVNSDYPNVWYSESICRKGSVLYQVKNDVVVLSHNLSNQTFDFKYGNAFILGKAQFANGADGTFNGYVDNFKTVKGSSQNIPIDKPAVHLPLETNAINVGFSALTINNMGGTPTYDTISGKKCIKIENGKYLNINSNNIFNMDSKSDFYIELDFYPLFDRGQVLLSNNSSSTTNLFTITLAASTAAATSIRQKIYIHTNDYYNGENTISSSNTYNINQWNNVKISKNGDYITFVLNGVTTVRYYERELNFSLNGTNIGNANYTSTAYFDGYISNYKMFVGTSEISESYDDKSVIDVDFKPTRKSYLFKDNFNKCVIHPVNITQRGYKNSQYCVELNGTNQYIQLGKNELFNFGYDDFILKIKFSLNDMSDTFNFLFGAYHDGQTTNRRPYIGIASASHPTVEYRQKLIFDISGDTPDVKIVSDTNIDINTIYTIILVCKDKVVSLYINDVLQSQTITLVTPINFNDGNNTLIGWNATTTTSGDANTYINAIFYNIKAFRNTADLTLLEDSVDNVVENFILTNGTDIVSKEYDTSTIHSLQVVNDIDKVAVKIDSDILEVEKDSNISDVVLFNEYTGLINDIRVYDTPFYDNDIYEGSQLVDFQYPELNIDNDIEELHVLDVGDYIITGFIEGYTDRPFLIYNKEKEYVLYEGIEDYAVNGINESYKDEFEIHDKVNGQKYSLYNHTMIKGYISGNVNIANCGNNINMKVYCYRNDNNRLIGVYDLDSLNNYNIPNLDVNSYYDIVFKENNRKLENISSSYRKPKSY